MIVYAIGSRYNAPRGTGIYVMSALEAGIRYKRTLFITLITILAWGLRYKRDSNKNWGNLVSAFRLALMFSVLLFSYGHK